MVPIAQKSRSKSQSLGEAKLQAKVDDLERKLDKIIRDVDALIDRFTPAPERDPLLHRITEEMRQRMLLQAAQAQHQMAQAQQNHSLAQQAQYHQGLAQQQLRNAQFFQHGGPYDMVGWGDCTCIPGRSALLRGDN